MSRHYSEKFLRDLAAADETNNLGIQLGRLCVEANLPASYVAEALETTRMTVSQWFRGQQIRAKKHPRILKFMEIVNGDMGTEHVPAHTMVGAKWYIFNVVAPQLPPGDETSDK